MVNLWGLFHHPNKAALTSIQHHLRPALTTHTMMIELHLPTIRNLGSVPLKSLTLQFFLLPSPVSLHIHALIALAIVVRLLMMTFVSLL
jgi:hypothetical protein